MKPTIIRITFILLLVLQKTVAGPLDAHRLNLIENKDDKSIISIECQSPEGNLIYCDNYFFIKSYIIQKDRERRYVEYKRIRISKKKFEEAITQFSKEFGAKTLFPFVGKFGAAMGIPAYLIGGLKFAIPVALIFGLAGTTIDLALTPIHIPVRIKRIIHKKIMIQYNINNLLKNKKFKKIILRNGLLNRNHNSFLLGSIIREKVSP